jgi:hypothetical protein
MRAIGWPTGARRSLAVLASAAAPNVQLPAGLVNQTPLIQSLPLSALTGCNVLLKMDALQPTGSFKDRGMAFMCATLQARGTTDLISSSGGNAGLAASAAGRKLGMRVRVIVPTTTKKIMLDKIKAEGAEVEMHGVNWNAADVRARQLVAQSDAAAYVPPYEDPLLWEGHSSIVDELVCRTRPRGKLEDWGQRGQQCAAGRLLDAFMNWMRSEAGRSPQAARGCTAGGGPCVRVILCSAAPPTPGRIANCMPHPQRPPAAPPQLHRNLSLRRMLQCDNFACEACPVAPHHP